MSRLFPIFPLLGIVFCLNAPLVAQEASAKPEVTIEELVQIALEHNPELAQTHHQEEAASGELNALRAFPNPRLELAPRLAGDDEAADSEAILAQPLDVFGKRRAAAKVQQAQLQAAVAKSTFTRRSLIARVKRSAVNLYGAQEAETLILEQVNIARQFSNASKRRADLGDVPQVEAQRAALELLRAENDLANIREERLSRLAALNQLLGKAPGDEWNIALPQTSPDVRYPEIPVAVREQLIEEALRNRADLQAEEAIWQADKAQVDAIAKERLPDVEVQARRGSLLGGENSSYGVRATITLPLFDFGSLKHRKRAAVAESRAQEANVQLTRLEIATEVQQALVQLQRERQNLQRFRAGIVPQTLELLRKTQIGYDQGASTYLEVLDAQRTLKQVQTEYLQALAGTMAAEATLEKAIGAPLPASISAFDTPQGSAP